MKKSTLENWTWVLIYGGLLSVGLGWSLQRQDNALGWAVVIGGLCATALGAVCIFVRSRLKDTEQP